MLTEMNYWNVIDSKIRRQENIDQIEYHAGGNCVHIGKISPGCRICFTNEFGGGIQIGNMCMCKCPMCYYPKNRSEMSKDEINNIISNQFFNNLSGAKPLSYAYQSAGETLMYVDDLEKVAAIHRTMDRQQGIQIYHHLYTNGILANRSMLERLKRMGMHELRFHLSASNFSQSVIENMYIAAEMGFSVTVEEPAWPLHKDQLFKLLEIFEDIGVIHLDIVETQLTEYNFNDIQKEYTNGRYYKDFYYHLYDEGLVYDIMEEVVSKGYNYSVLDCNSAVERSRHGKFQHVGFNMNSIGGMCDDFPYTLPKTDDDWFYNKNKKRLEQLKSNRG